MTSLIGLAVYGGLILWLLRLDRKQFPEASPFLWIPTVWIVLISSRGLAFWLGAPVYDVEAGSAPDRVFQIFVFFAGLLILAKREIRWSSVIRENPWVALLLGYMLVSILWSEFPFVSFKRWVRQLVALVMALLVATEDDPRRALEAVIRRTIYILIPLSLLLIQFYPHLGVHYGSDGSVWWRGIAHQKNGLARFCFFSLFFFIWTFVRRRRGGNAAVVWYQTYFEVGIFLLTLYLFMGPRHRLTYSAASTAALLVGLAVFWWISWRKKRGKTIGSVGLRLILGMLLIYTIIIPFVGGMMMSDIASYLGRSETLTGRALIWEELIVYAMERPFLGLGYGAYMGEANPHNGPLAVILNLGFVGVGLLSIFLLSSCARASNEMLRDFDWGALWLCYLLMAVVHNVAEATISSFGGQLSAILLFFYVCHKGASYKKQIVRKVVGQNTETSRRNKSMQHVQASRI